ncbi:MAG: 30S ribosomal protein S12 methylthiotransferase RimO [Lachnospiraceae bacterium]|nr:30S ribosomal protein S12 methylthiotransferase RimO [Lachnospiraceae bacterium]
MTVFLLSLGCDKNLVDSEIMTGLLRDRGFEFTDDEEKADAVIINSCCFIGDAKEESIGAVIEAGRLKEEGKVKYIVLAGCLAERYSKEIGSELPEVDAVIGTTAIDSIVDVLNRLSKESKEKIVEIKDKDLPVFPEVSRSISTGGHYEYLKIAEGCDKNCSYCIIPSVRGHYRSVPMERIIKDAGELVEQGVKELILIAQETTVYGKDLYGRKSLAELLRRLNDIPELKWIRLMYCYPEEIDRELISAIKELPKVCHYLDLPVQHCSDRILKKMGRRTSKADIGNLIRELRKEIPDITLRTTLITGFPGETEEEHEELLRFVESSGFDRLGVFKYSPEEGTAAALFPDQTEESVKEQRLDELMTLQQEISLSVNEGQKGKELDCIIEGRIPEEGVYVARSYRDAPNVDGMVFIDEEGVKGELMTGDFVRVRITGASEYDLYGAII